MIGESIPSAGLAYRMGVRNIRKVMRNESAFPISLMIPLRRERRKPKPMVRRINGISRIGKRKIVGLGVIL